jgi:5-methyltetrahydrofolate--homocysteine methyltransferase|tara:strand:- start:2677 stop:3552 length:876 start_codon:yes stop_codon:yes gene_type:complete
VEIGSGRRFVIIGERINPTNRKKLAAMLQAIEDDAGNQGSAEFKEAAAYLQAEAVRQVDSGAAVLDVNVGYAGAEEQILMPLAVRIVLEAVDVPLSIDSPSPQAVGAGLKAYVEVTGGGKALVNSTTAEPDRMDLVLPLVAEYGAAVVGLAHGIDGIPDNADGRIAAVETILEESSSYDIPAEDLLIDALTLTVGADHRAPGVCLETTRRVSEELNLNTTSGASNVAFGLPDRHRINLSYIPMLIQAGLTSAITNSNEEEVVATLKATDMLSGNDPSCLNWIKYQRSKEKV